MGLLEDELRRTLADRVATPPAVEGLADRAIVGAGRLRRRRLVLTPVATVLCVALALVGINAVVNADSGRPQPMGTGSAVTPTSAPPPAIAPVAGLPADMLVQDAASQSWILTTEAGAVPLGVTAGRAWRVDEGWLVESGDARRLELVNRSGSRTTLVEGDAVMVSPGTQARPGVQVAWVAAGVLRLGTYAQGVVVDPVTTSGVRASGGQPLRPWRVVDATVVLAGTMTGGGLDSWDFWTPARGGYVPSGQGNPGGLLSVLGVTEDNARVIALYQDGPGDMSGCLGEFDPDGMRLVRSTCSQRLTLDDRVLSSPDGRWLVVIGQRDAALYEAQALWSGGGPAATWPGQVIDAAWLGDGLSFAVLTPNAVRTHYTDGRADAVIALPADVRSPWLASDPR